MCQHKGFGLVVMGRGITEVLQASHYVRTALMMMLSMYQITLRSTISRILSISRMLSIGGIFTFGGILSLKIYSLLIGIFIH